MPHLLKSIKPVVAARVSPWMYQLGPYDLLHGLGFYRLLKKKFAGVGVVFLFHRVTEDVTQTLAVDLTTSAEFLDNTLHRVTEDVTQTLAVDLTTSAEFLDNTLDRVRREGWDVISIDEVHRRVTEGESDRPFVCCTFDDGFRDNLTIALPVFRRHNAPFCVYLATGMMDRTINVWWAAVEQIILENDTVDIVDEDGRRKLPTRSLAEKRSTYEHLKSIRRDSKSYDMFDRLFDSYGWNSRRVLENFALTWDEARVLAGDPLVTIGAHTVTHSNLTTLSMESARFEMAESARIIDEQLGITTEHFSYPFGAAGPREWRMAAQLGFKTAVSTIEGSVQAAHRDGLTRLPRRDMNMGRETERYVRNCLYGADNWKRVFRAGS